MKKIIFISLLFITVILFGSNAYAGQRELRGVWVATVINLDWPSAPGLSAAQMKAEADAILDHAAYLGLNTVFFQVRPAGDAMYRSEIFPWSMYLTGTQGQAPPDDFDPLRYWIDAAHARGLELHAWINPYRVTHHTQRINNVNNPAIHPSNPARLNPDMVRAFHNNNTYALYLDPGHPDSRDLIIRGVIELLQNYNVDGIHFDDYFYPFPPPVLADSFDEASWQAFGVPAGWTNRADWRRDNINTMIREVQSAIQETNPDVLFGISPFAIWQNERNHPLGSATSGLESYHAIFTDVRYWAQHGLVDYVVPQIYWPIGNPAACFSVVLHWWRDLTYRTGVDLFVGMAPYREVEERANWQGETLRQLNYMQQFEGIGGMVFFRAMHLNGHVGETIKYFFDNQSYFDGTFLPTTPPGGTGTDLTIVQPRTNVSLTNAAGYFMFGASNPYEPLYINGQRVTNRTPEGFWSHFATLTQGDNVFTITQYGQASVTRTITNRSPEPATGTPPPPPPPITINPVPAAIPLYATVREIIWAFPSHTTTGGSDLMLMPGQRDKVTGVTSDGDWIRLSSGVWVQASGVTLVHEPRLFLNVLRNGRYYQDWPDLHSITWDASVIPILNTVYDGRTVTVYFGMHTIVPFLDIYRFLPLDDTIFSSVESGIWNGVPFYRFTLREGVQLEGYWTNQRGDEFRMYFKLRKELNPNPTRPLEGFVFLIDPGHGGPAHGALGALGTTMPESRIALNISRILQTRLEGLGAYVELTRTAEVDITLQARATHSWHMKPDMFISIHTDSTAETTDATNIRGATVYFRNELSRPAANVMTTHMHAANPHTTRAFGARTANFFVLRPSWVPSLLIESSFTNNIHDFSWLINPENQERVADAIVTAILEYFGMPTWE
ncbi:MAG: family 10 glycosylhydrolase [Defluviitaleaceae bacterium]|nr:family 10 glycosylhydrolase [Defluviitaleaceae bacterium]